jgi:hypothetical protein
VSKIATKIALATSLPAFLVGATAAVAEVKEGPTAKDVGQALISAELQLCRDTNASDPIRQSHCSLDMRFPTRVDFGQFLCAVTRYDSSKNPISSCVFKGQKRVYPAPFPFLIEEQKGDEIKIGDNPEKLPPAIEYGDGLIELIYTDGDWRLLPEPAISIE